MAGVHQLGWKAIPAVRSGYGADTLGDADDFLDSQEIKHVY